MYSLQTQIQERGERIFALVDRHPESLFSQAGFYQRMMALSMRDERRGRRIMTGFATLNWLNR